MNSKMKEIIFFLFIFSMVFNVLSVLNIASSDYGNTPVGTNPTSALTLITLHIVGTIGGALAVGIAASIKIFGSGQSMPGNQIFAYGLLGGILTSTLIGALNAFVNIYNALPSDYRVPVGMLMYIFISVVMVLVSFMYIDYTFGVSPE